MSALIAFLLEPLFLMSIGVILLLASVWIETRFWGFVGLGILGYLGYNIDFDPKYFFLLIPYFLAGFAYSLFCYKEFVELKWEYHEAYLHRNNSLSPSENKARIVNWIIFWPVDLFVQITSRFTDAIFATVNSGFVKIFEAHQNEHRAKEPQSERNGR